MNPNTLTVFTFCLSSLARAVRDRLPGNPSPQPAGACAQADPPLPQRGGQRSADQNPRRGLAPAAGAGARVSNTHLPAHPNIIELQSTDSMSFTALFYNGAIAQTPEPGLCGTVPLSATARACSLRFLDTLPGQHLSTHHFSYRMWERHLRRRIDAYFH